MLREKTLTPKSLILSDQSMCCRLFSAQAKSSEMAETGFRTEGAIQVEKNLVQNDL